MGCQPCEAFQSTPPSAPLSGDLWIDTSSGPPYQLKVWNGTAWQNVGVVTGGGGGGGGGGAQVFFAPFTAPPAAATWTLFNPGSATLADIAQGVFLDTPSNAGVLVGAVRATGGTPWQVQTVFALHGMTTAPTGGGLCFRESSTGKLSIHYFQPVAGAGFHEWWTNPTTFNSAQAGVFQFSDLRSVAGLAWVRAGDDGTNRHIDISTDGQHWFNRYNESHSGFFVADQVGIVVRASSPDNGLLLFSWG